MSAAESVRRAPADTDEICDIACCERKVRTLKALIVSYSKFGNTKRLAESMAETIRQQAEVCAL